MIDEQIHGKPIPELACQESEREKAMALALHYALRIIKNYEVMFPSGYMRWGDSYLKGSDFVKTIAQGEKVS